MSSLSNARASLGGRSLAKALALVQPKEVYSFPILEAEEVTEVLREMGAAVVEEDLNKPKADVFRQWCELFCIEILGINKDELYHAHFEFAEALDGNEELHEASVPILHFIRNMNKVLTAARCDEGMSLRDLMRPERARVLRVLSALINLQKFKAEKLVWYQEQEEKKLVVVRRREALEAQHEDFKRRIDAERSLRDAEQPAISAEQARRRFLESQRDELSARLEGLRAETKVAKEELRAARDAAVELQQRVAEVKAEADVVRAQIVTSPEKVRAELAAAENALAVEKRALEEADAARRLVARKMEIVAKADKDVTKAITLMGEAEVECLKLKRVQKEEKARRSEAEAAAGEVEALKAQLKLTQAAQARASEKLSDVRASYEARSAAREAEIAALRRETAEIQEEIKASQDAHRAAGAEAMRLERHKAALISAHATEVADMVSSLKRLASSTNAYHANIQQALANVAAGL